MVVCFVGTYKKRNKGPKGLSKVIMLDHATQQQQLNGWDERANLERMLCNEHFGFIPIENYPKIPENTRISTYKMP